MHIAINFTLLSGPYFQTGIRLYGYGNAKFILLFVELSSSLYTILSIASVFTNTDQQSIPCIHGKDSIGNWQVNFGYNQNCFNKTNLKNSYTFKLIHHHQAKIIILQFGEIELSVSVGNLDFARCFYYIFTFPVHRLGVV